MKPVVNQVECHPLLAQRKLIEHCARHGIVIAAYSPLGGTPADPATEAKITRSNFDVRRTLFSNELITQLAAKYNKSIGQILLKFHVQRGVIAITKSVTQSRIAENANIFDFEMTNDEINALEALDCNMRYIHVRNVAGHKQYPFHVDY